MKDKDNVGSPFQVMFSALTVQCILTCPNPFVPGWAICRKGGGGGGELGVFKKRGGVAARSGLKYNGSVSWIGMFSTPLISLVVNVNIFMI